MSRAICFVFCALFSSSAAQIWEELQNTGSTGLTNYGSHKSDFFNRTARAAVPPSTPTAFLGTYQCTCIIPNNYPTHIYEWQNGLKFYYFVSGDTLTLRQSYITDKTRMTLEGSGDLVVYRNCDNSVLWNSGTAGKNAKEATLEKTGNFVIKDIVGNIIWETKTTDIPGASLFLPSNDYMFLCVVMVTGTDASTYSTGKQRFVSNALAVNC